MAPFFFSASLFFAVTGLVNLIVFMPYAESQEVRAHKSDISDSHGSVRTCGVGSSKRHSLYSRSVERKMCRKAYGNVSTSSCDRPGVITHAPAPPSRFYQYVLMRNKVEKISSWVPISKPELFTVAFLILHFNHTALIFQHVVISVFRAVQYEAKMPVEAEKKKNNLIVLPVYHFEQHSSIRACSLGHRVLGKRSQSWK